MGIQMKNGLPICPVCGYDFSMNDGVKLPVVKNNNIIFGATDPV